MNEPTKASLLTAFCLGVGKFLHDWQKFPNWLIPHSVTVAGAAAGVAYAYHEASSLWSGGIEGALLGAAATGIHQIKDQTATLNPK